MFVSEAPFIWCEADAEVAHGLLGEASLDEVGFDFGALQEMSLVEQCDFFEELVETLAF